MTKHATVSVIALAAAVSLTGCRTQDRYADVSVGPAPKVDEAIMLRDWPVTRAEYASGDVIAGSVGFLWEVDEDVEEAGNFALQVPAFLGNVIVLPVTIFLPPPTEEFVYEGAVIPESYTANPPLPKRATLPASPVAPTTQPTTLPATDADDQVPDLVPTTIPAEPADGFEGTDVEAEVEAEVDDMSATPRRETEPVAPVTPATTREFEK
ncbi:MAG: hypothetical protein AAF743_08645 [Planctomycetota bacterium]